MSTQTTEDPNKLLAVVGMAGRFPGAKDVTALWQRLVQRDDAITPIPAERWDTNAQLDPEKRVQSVGGFLEDVDQFDPMFFGISPREAEDVDPQHRLLLEVSYRALEDGGQSLSRISGSRTGVYVGASWHDYELLRKERGAKTTQHSIVGTALDMSAARLSYFYKLKGPSLTVETGCSSSLVALHLAGQALRAGEIDAAIVGGVNLILAPDVSVGLTHFGGLSPDGRCKAFAASANGFVRGEGVVALYVKTLARALADGDEVHGVIVSTTVNNDGGGDSLVTPSVAGQEDLLRRAYRDAAIPLDHLLYVEAHGTGTSRGDPIEAGALGRVLAKSRDPKAGRLHVGSIKSVIGHLEATAGLAGLVKVLLSLKHGFVPANLHADELNPNIPFDDLNLEVVRAPLAIDPVRDVYLGVNSFGWGGTNAHAIVTRAPRAEATAVDKKHGATFVALSAHREDVLSNRVSALGVCVREQDLRLADVAFSAACRSTHFAHRAAFVVSERDELLEGLRQFADDPAASDACFVTGKAREKGRIAFVFPGQGSQWAEMGKVLFRESPKFAEVIQRCSDALRPFVSWDLVSFVSGEAGDSWLNGIDTLQPTLWGMMVALAELWREAGIEPDVVVGHSMGEVAAAAVSGALSYDDAARVIARRSAIAQSKAGRGRMLSVDLSLEAAKAALAGFEDRVALAVNNGPTSCVLSGDTDAVEVLKQLLEADGVFCRYVRVDFASHCHQMDEFKAELFNALEGITPRGGATPLMSTVLTRELCGTEMDASYWVKNLREPVLFAESMTRLFQDGVTHVIEISPHPVLTPALEQLVALESDPPEVLATLWRDCGSPRDLMRAFARAYVSGLEPFAGMRGASSVALPSYPWQRSRFWLSEGPRRGAGTNSSTLSLVPSSREQGVLEARFGLGTADSPWLADHKVHETVLLPGVAMIGLFLDVASARGFKTPLQLAEITLSEKLALVDAPTQASLVFQDDVSEGGSLSLQSLAEGMSTWSVHATARLESVSNPHSPPPFPSWLRTGTELASASFYETCHAKGLCYGPAFRGLTDLRVRETAALGRVELPEACAASVRSGALHPALWDAALQVLLALTEGDETVVPTGVERLIVHRAWDKVTSGFSYVERRADGSFDLTFYDRAEQPLLEMRGISLTVMPREQGEAVDMQRICRLAFQEAAAEGSATPAGLWVVCGARAEVNALASQMSASGLSVHRMVHLDTDGEAQADAVLARLRAAGEPTGIVYVAPRDEDSLAHREHLLTIASLVKAATGFVTPPRVAIVTAGAQAVLDGDELRPEAALYWGFARVLRREHPELAPLVLDVDLHDADWASGVLRELVLGTSEDQVALRGARRFVGRLVRGEASEVDAKKACWTSPAQPFRVSAVRPGFWDGLEHRPLARTKPGECEIEIEVRASSLNFIDVMKAMGTYPGVEGRAALLGGECAGRVLRVGEGVHGFAVGDRVVACAFGSLASHTTVPAQHVRKIPDALSDEEAAALPLVMMTAYYALRDLARLEPSETVLIHSATGGLGLAAIQVAKLLGARIIATAGTESKRAYLRELGIEHVFDSRDLAWAAQVRDATSGRGVDVVLNSLTGAAIELGLDVLAEDGRFVEVGKKDIYSGRRLRLTAFKKGVSLASVDLAGLMERRQARFARLFSEVWALVREGKLAPIPTRVFAFKEAPDALRTMSHGLHIGKIVVANPESVDQVAPEPLAKGCFRSDATYLITGGLGALGLSLAESMAQRGARAFALVGRSTPTQDAQIRIDALLAQGIIVHTASVDVADAAAVGEALAELRSRMPPLRGVIHAAGLLDDATILNLTRKQLERVLAPKVEGAQNLDRLTREDPLDLFVLFSSAAALIGNAGQAAYAAGNSFMDTLAEARRRRGKPALSVNWGPFAEVGLAARDSNRGARLAERGMGSFSTEEAFAALYRFLERDEQLVGYVPLDLRQWFDAYPDTAAQPSWKVLRAAAEAGAASTSASSFAEQLSSAEDSARKELAESKVRELAGRVLRLEPTAIALDMPFKALGLDSLMGLELRNRLEAAFGLRLSPTLLWTYGNSRALASVLCERVAAVVEA